MHEVCCWVVSRAALFASAKITHSRPDSKSLSTSLAKLIVIPSELLLRSEVEALASATEPCAEIGSGAAGSRAVPTRHLSEQRHNARLARILTLDTLSFNPISLRALGAIAVQIRPLHIKMNGNFTRSQLCRFDP